MCGLPKAPDTPAASTKGMSSPSSTAPGTHDDYQSSQGPNFAGSSSNTSPPSSSIGGYDPPAASSSIGGYEPNGPSAGFHGITSTSGTGALDPQDTAAYSDLFNSMALPMDGLLWDSNIFPQSFPTPWFANQEGAGALYQPLLEVPAFMPELNGIYTNETGWEGAPLQNDKWTGWSQNVEGFDPSMANSQAATLQAGLEKPISQIGFQIEAEKGQQSLLELEPNSTFGIDISNSQIVPSRQPQAWGVDMRQFQMDDVNGHHQGEGGQDDDGDDYEDAEPMPVGPDGPFPPGVSLARCVTAAHSIVRLQVLHRSATLAMSKQ